jgi:murein endopeptidase
MDFDDWGVLAMLNVLEGVGRDWYSGDEVLPRVGIGDISKGDTSTQQFGGEWTGHGSHENGLDVDVRYVRCDKSEGSLNIAANPSNYDMNLTSNLISDFIRSGRILLILVDTVNIGFDCDYFVHWLDHSDHFHVRIVDPDGTDNKVKKRVGRVR